MNLGKYTVGVPVFEIDSLVTFQTIRSPTVFERMIMRLCHRYREEPAVAEMTFQAVFEDFLGVSSATELVRPCIDNLMFLGVISRPAAQDAMLARLHDVSLTQDGIVFYERDRLPGRSKQITVKHTYQPLLSSIKLNKGAHGYKDLIPLPRINSNAFLPADSSILVRDALTKEKHTWKSVNTEIHTIESTVVKTLWEDQIIDIDIDESGALTVTGESSKEFQKWIELADNEIVWNDILNPILNPPQDSDRVQIGDSALRFADSVTTINEADNDSLPGFRSAKSALVVLSRAGSTKYVNGVPAIVLSHDCKSAKRIETDDGTLVVEVPYPSNLTKGFHWLGLSNNDLTPSAAITGLTSLSWGGQARSGSLLIHLQRDQNDQIWSLLKTSLAESLSGSIDSGLLAFSALWGSTEDTIQRWIKKIARLPITELVSDALIFAPALEKFAVKSDLICQDGWRPILSDVLMLACNRVETPIDDEHLVDLTQSVRKLLADRGDEVSFALLTHAKTINDLARLESIRNAIGVTAPLPLALLGTSLIETWLKDALSDVKPVFHGPHNLEPIISAIASAYQRVLRDIGLVSLEGSVNGTLNLKYVKANALDSAQNWINVYVRLEEQLMAIAISVSQPVTDFHQKVLTWQSLACKHLAPPTETDHRLIVLDTSALMVAPDLVGRMRQRDIPVLPRRVLEELDGLKESQDNQKAQSARAAIRAIESSSSRIRFESEALDLIPPDWERSSDNRILSVAMYLRLSEVLLITGDINFRNKARAEEIRAQTPDEYRGISQGNKITGSGNNKKKKGKK